MNRDVLRHIVLKIDNPTLKKLIDIPSLSETIRSFLSDMDFWRRKTELLIDTKLEPRQGIDWKMIYRVFSSGTKMHVKMAALSNLDAVKIVGEVYGYLLPNDAYPWLHASAEVLKYLLGTGRLIYDEEMASSRLYEAAKTGQTDAIKYLLPLNEAVWSSASLEEWLNLAVRGGHLETTKYLFSLIRGELNWSDLLVSAVLSKSQQMVRYILDREQYDQTPVLRAALSRALIENESLIFKTIFRRAVENGGLDLRYKQQLFSDALRGGKAQIAQILLEHDDQVRDGKPLRTMLNDACRYGLSDLVKYLLTLVSPATEKNQSLKYAIQSGNLEVFKIILDDPRTDPEADLQAVLKELMHSGYLYHSSLFLNEPVPDHPINVRAQMALLLAQDERINLDKLELNTVLYMLYSIFPYARRKVLAIHRASLEFGVQPSTHIELHRLVTTRRDNYSLLLRFIIIRSPTEDQVFGWMIKHRDKHLVEAAKSAKAGVLASNDLAVAYQALILVFVNPQVSNEQLASDLREEDASEDALLLASRLIGAYKPEASLKQA